MNELKRQYKDKKESVAKVKEIEFIWKLPTVAFKSGFDLFRKGPRH